MLEGIPQSQKIILVSSFADPVRRNQLGKTGKHILLHGAVKSAISDVSASLQTHLWSDTTLDSSGQTSLILQRQIRGYKTLKRPTKHQKAIPAKLVLNIYKRNDTHLNTAIGQLITGAFLFGMRSCEYSTTPKGEENAHAFFRKATYASKENAENFPTTVGSSTELTRSPQYSTHRKMGSKMSQCQSGGQPQPSAQ